MAKERLILVTQFDQLKAGSVVVVKNCSACGRDCRSICVRLRSGIESETETYVPRMWETIPPCHIEPGDIGNAIDEISVANGKVYLVDTGIEGTETAENETANPRAARRFMRIGR